VVCPESGGTTVRAVLPYGAATPTVPVTVPRTEPARSAR
jgi:hypothetical protein